MSGKMVLYKLVVLGDGGVGKTALTIQLTLQHFVETVRKSLELQLILLMLGSNISDTATNDVYSMTLRSKIPIGSR
jgi:GTPase SAR1 family protein